MNKAIPKQAVFVSYHRINKKIDNYRYFNTKGDLIVVKEKWKEGDEVKKKIRMVENFERPYWITKPHLRKHKDKREWASLEDVHRYACPQWDLSRHVQKSLGMYNADPNLPIRYVNRSPYVYGTDLSPSYLVKEMYAHKYNDYRAGPCDVCVLDIETDVLGTEENKVILLSTVLNGHGVIHALKDFIGKKATDYERRFFDILDKDLPDVRGKNGYTVELKVYDTEIDLIEAAFKYLHREMPDFVTGWNVMEFDQRVLAERIIANGRDPAEFFSAPNVPTRYKNYRYVEGRKFMVSDSGKKTNLRPIARWHEVDSPASFKWIDAMATYYQLRKHKGMESSYKLDYIMNKNLKLGKYEIEEAASKKGLSKHIYMQQRHPVHYAVYNLFDSICVDMLDKKNGDIRNTFNVLLGNSDFRSNQSNPTKLVDDFHSFLYYEKGYVIGSTSDQMFTDWDKQLPPLSGWIVALPTTNIDAGIGKFMMEEAPYVRSKFCNHAGDDDIESSYPQGGRLNNISRFTTEIEVSEIEGVSMDDRYEFGLNLMAGSVNSVSNARITFKVPDFVSIEKDFDSIYGEFIADR